MLTVTCSLIAQVKSGLSILYSNSNGQVSCNNLFKVSDLIKFLIVTLCIVLWRYNYELIYFKMKKIVLFLILFQILVVQSSSDICLKSYKKKLCLRLSIKKFNSCLFEQFTVFEQNDKFCVSNTKCVSKIVDCLGIFLHL